MSFEQDPFEIEKDLQTWASEMGEKYELGSQGSHGQPLRDMDLARLEALDGSITQELREDSGLPAIPDADELGLHVTSASFAAMTEDEKLKWQVDSLGWLLEHPNARLSDLFDD